MKKYPWAVVDGNRPSDMSQAPESCHMTYAAAARAARRANGEDPNYHYYVCEWGSGRWDRLRPNDAHYPAAKWISEEQARQFFEVVAR